MKNSFLALFMLLFADSAFAAPVRRLYQDVKLPTQQVIEKQTITNPAVADTNGILASSSGATSAAAVTVSSGLSNPSVPRNLVITPFGTAADMTACDVVVNGTDFHGKALAETFTMTNNSTAATTGTKAFKTVTSVVFPANCEDGSFGADWKIGQGEKIGLKRCMTDAGDWVSSSVAGVYETTRATVTANSSTVALNTADFNGTMDGTADFNAYFHQSFDTRCMP